jgi:EAL domain-containing protein (putative c-di-GMP-specific phosphodiesterase class I)
VRRSQSRCNTIAEANPAQFDLTEFISRFVSGEPLYHLVTQPIVDMETMTIRGYEVLARFNAPVGIDNFFLQAGQLGLGADIEATLVAAALRMLHRMPNGLRLHINLSPAYLTKQEILDHLLEADLNHVVVELTEHLAIGNQEGMLAILKQLRQSGALIAIDDAGAGQGGIHLLAAVEPDIVKIDRCLIYDIDKDSRKQALVSALTRYCQSIGATVVAEGIERAGELIELSNLGIRYGQGFIFGFPSEGFARLDIAKVIGLSRLERKILLGTNLVDLVEWVPSARSVTGFSDQQIGVIVDEFRRPIYLWQRVANSERISVPSEIEVGSTLEMARSKIIHRATNLRCDPLVVVDKLHRLVGILRLERLLDTTASERQ